MAAQLLPYVILLAGSIVTGVSIFIDTMSERAAPSGHKHLKQSGIFLIILTGFILVVGCINQYLSNSQTEFIRKERDSWQRMSILTSLRQADAVYRGEICLQIPSEISNEKDFERILFSNEFNSHTMSGFATFQTHLNAIEAYESGQSNKSFVTKRSVDIANELVQAIRISVASEMAMNPAAIYADLQPPKNPRNSALIIIDLNVRLKNNDFKTARRIADYWKYQLRKGKLEIPLGSDSLLAIRADIEVNNETIKVKHNHVSAKWYITGEPVVEAVDI